MSGADGAPPNWKEEEGIAMQDMIAISQVVVPPEREAVNEESIAALMESIRLVGLLAPITLRPDYTLVAGRSRLEACRRLFHPQIAVRWLSSNDPAEETIAEVDENLVRRDIPALLRVELQRRRQLAYETVHRDQPAHELRASFIRDVGKQTGASQFSTNRNRYIGEHLLPEVAEQLRGTPYAANKTLLYELAQKTHDGQRDGARELLAALRRGESPRGKTKRAATTRANVTVTKRHGAEGSEDPWQKQAQTSEVVQFPGMTPRASSPWDEIFALLERLVEKGKDRRGLKAETQRLAPVEQETRLDLLDLAAPMIADWQQVMTRASRRRARTPRSS